jgi:DNA-binding response OmpR family regulator/signal transduction histidine kinase
MRILYVEDELELADAVQQNLQREGFAVDCLATLDDAEAALRAADYDVVLLDLALPDGDGLRLVQRLRAARDSTPVIAVTARDGIDDRVRGLNSGADDYLVKPFAQEELVARLRAILRRPGTVLAQRLTVGRLSMDTSTGETFVDDQALAVPRRERAVLELLLRRAGRVVQRGTIENGAYGFNEEPTSKVVEAQVSRLRRRLAQAIEGALARQENGLLALRPDPALFAVVAAAPGLRYVVVDAASGRVVTGSSASLVGALGADQTNPEQPVPASVPAPGGGSEKVTTSNVETPAGPIRLLSTGGYGPSADLLEWASHEIGHDLLPFLVPLFVGTLIIAPLTVRRGLAPLRALSAQAGQIEPRASSGRLGAEGVPAEILPLVRAVNLALQRLDEGFQLQRRFTANAAHELRTPLALLRARIDGLGAIEGAEGLKQAIDRMAHLVDQLLSVARLEARQIAADQPVEMVALARNVLADLAPLAIARGREVELNAATGVAWVTGNGAVLGEALRNLVENALVASRPGETVELCVADAGQLGVTIEVRDRGPGVPEADRKRIFEPFWRNAAGRHGGTGLGLAIVAESMALHGGTVTVETRRGGGAVFRLTLPAYERSTSGA